MRFHKNLAFVGMVLLVATAAYASPVFGRWTGELNGRAVTIVIDNVQHRAEGKFMVAAGSGAAQEVQITNPRFSNSGRTVTFDVPNQGGLAKLVSAEGRVLTFELQVTGTDEAELRVVDKGANAPVINLVRRK